MMLLFSPAQGERVTVDVPPHSSSIELQFSAAFASLEDEREARLDGVKVELWSDIPMAHGMGGQWGALGFEWASNHTDSGEISAGISEGTSNPMVLHLRTRILISGRSQVQYTYRLVYPSGKINWLGDYEHDGVLVFERKDPASSHGIFLGTGDGTFFLGQDRWDNMEVMRLSRDIGWSIYAIREDGSSCIFASGGHISSTRISLAFFAPVICPESLVIPHAFSLAASRGSSILINALGSISIIGAAKGSIFVHIYDADTKPHLREAAIHDSLSFCSFQTSYQLLPCDCSSRYTVLASQAMTCPKFVSVIPFVTTLSSTDHIGLRMHSLCDLLPPGTSELVLFSCSSSRPRFLDVPSDEQSEEAVSLLVGPGCSQFIVAPVYTLRSRRRVWGVSILTPHVLVTADIMKIDHLPTPPPSPPSFQPFTLNHRRPYVSPAPSKSPQHIQRRITGDADPRLAALTIWEPSSIVRYISYIISLAIWLFKLWLLRILLYYSVRRLPYEGIDDWSEEEDQLDDGTIVWEDIVVEEDEPSVKRAVDTAFVAEWDEKGDDYVPLLLDVAGRDVSVLLRPVMRVSLADFITIELDGKLVKPDVQAIGDGMYLVGFRGHSTGGRVSIFA